MGRKHRVLIHNEFYHVVCRGNRRDPLFLHASDFQAFHHILQQLHEDTPFEIAAYCLMTNIIIFKFDLKILPYQDSWQS